MIIDTDENLKGCDSNAGKLVQGGTHVPVAEIEARNRAEQRDEHSPIKSFGQHLVGSHFNPSGDDNVGRVKQLFAEIADIVQSHHADQSNQESASRFQAQLAPLLYTNTIGEILNAQMNAVKLLTFKY